LKPTALDTLFRLNDYALKRRKGAIMDVGDWLRSFGLEQYEATFRENEIDVLPSLAAEDLKDLGVNIFGHRRLLLDAVVAVNIIF
jgi:hypothetical protein